MEEIIFVTHNKGKVASANRDCKNINFKVFDYEVDEPRSESLQEIAKSKVEQAYKLIKKPCIAMDSGFFIEALNGFPKTFVNFSLETIGIEGILNLMKEKENRKCSFKECLAYYDGKEIKYFYGETKGELSKEILGQDRAKSWSDLWYIFKPQNFDKTMAQMSDEERELRVKKDGSTSAFKVFADWYENNKINKKLKRMP